MVELPDFLRPLESVSCPFPRAAMEEAIIRWEESAPYFLAALTSVAKDFEAVPPDYLFHEYALRLCSQFRDARAYEPAMRLARHPKVDELLGDTITDGLGNILASVCGGKTHPLQELVEDEKADQFARAAGLTALGVLCRQGKLSRETFSEYLGGWFAGRFERGESFIWTALADVCGTFGFQEHEEAVREAWDAGLVDPYLDDWDHLQSQLRSGVFDESVARRYGFLDDAIGSMEHWHCFKPEADLEDEEFDNEDELRDDLPSWDDKLDELGEVPGPIRTEPKPGRNDPCFCGSGKKYKKCCG